MSRRIIQNLDSLLKVRQDINSNFEELYNRPSGGGGTTDYSDLDNKPSINGVTLDGNKTSADLKIEVTPGKDGSTWYNGNGAPGSDLGLDGDYYLDTGSGNIYNKTEGSWSIIMNIGSGGGSTPVAEVYLADYIYGGTPSVSQYSELKEAIDAGKIIVASYNFSGSTTYTQYIVCNATKDVDNRRIYVSYTYTYGNNISIVTKNYSISGESVSVNNSIKYLIDTKSIEDSLTSSSVSRVLSANQGKILKDLIDSLTSRVDSITGSFEIVIVDSLPDSGEPNKIYFVKKSSFLNDTYDEYMWINEAWEKLGTTSIDLSNYYTKTEADSLLENKQNKTDESLLTEAKDIVTAINEIYNKLGSGSGGTAELYEFPYLTKGTPSLEDFNNLKTAIQSGKIITGDILGLAPDKEYVVCHDSSASDNRIYLRYLYSSDDGPAIRTIFILLSSDKIRIGRLDKILITDFHVRDDLSGGEYTTDVLSANQGKVLKELIDSIDTSGTPGTPGTPGSVWYNGPGTPDIMIGTERDYYLDTTTYDIYSKASNNWEIIGNIKGAIGKQGEKGETGKPGSVWFNGAGAPTQETGLDGDYYLDSETGDVYNKVSNTWSKVANLKGPEGSGSSGGVTNFVITSEDDLITLEAKPGDTATFYNKTTVEGTAWKIANTATIEGAKSVTMSSSVWYNSVKSEYIQICSYVRTSDSKKVYALLKSTDALNWTYVKDMTTSKYIMYALDSVIVCRSSTSQKVVLLNADTYEEVEKGIDELGVSSDYFDGITKIVKLGNIYLASNNREGTSTYYSTIIKSSDGITWEKIDLGKTVYGLSVSNNKLYILFITSGNAEIGITDNLDTFEYKSIYTGAEINRRGIQRFEVVNNIAFIVDDGLDKIKCANLYLNTVTDLDLNLKNVDIAFTVHNDYLYIVFDGPSLKVIYKTSDGVSLDKVSIWIDDIPCRRLIIRDTNLILCDLGNSYYIPENKPNAVNEGGELAGDTITRRAYILVNDPTVKEDWLRLA